MLTYMCAKNAIEESCDLEDLILHIILLLLVPFVDIVFIILQPIFYLIYRKWVKENE